MKSSLLGLMVVAAPCMANAAITTVSAKFAEGSPPTLTTDVLGSSATITDTGVVGAGGSAFLNSDTLGAAGVTAAQITSDDTVTYTFDTTVNTLGYDITEISTYAGWDITAGGRSNQGYEIELTFVDSSTATLLGPATYEPNSAPEGFWTSVEHTNAGGGVLDNGGGVVASGVKSITWKTFDAANPGGDVQYREFDVVGSATPFPAPEPSTLVLAVLGLMGLGIRRRRTRL